MTQPLMTPKLSRRIEGALDAAARSRARGVAAVPGNPLEVEEATWGPLAGTRVSRPVLYYGYFSAIRGLTSDSDEALDEALAWVRQGSVPVRVTLSPFLVDGALLERLAGAGWRQAAFMSVLYGRPGAAAPAGEDIDTRELPPRQRDDFFRLWLRESQAQDRTLHRRLGEGEFRDWSVYAGYVDGEPGAYGCLYVDRTEKVAVLASAWTKPENRGRGLQSVLIARRMAASAGCDLVVSTAVPGSQSERNLRRAGLDYAYTQVIWTS